MKGISVVVLGTIASVFLPIQITAILLMFMIFIDTCVKMFSLRKEANSTGRKFKDVFSSKILRQGYLYKAGGYFIFTAAILPFDFYLLSPYVEHLVNLSDYILNVHMQAVFTNLLLLIFCLMELSSINENWYDISGSNMFRRITSIAMKIRESLKTVLSFKKDVDSLKK